MIHAKKCRKGSLILWWIILLPVYAFTQNSQNTIEIYGFIQTDAGYNFNSIDPDWFDVMRPTKLPKYQGQFGPTGTNFISIRQSRFGVKSSTTTQLGELKTQFDFDLVGFGKYSGQTHFH